MNEKIYFLTITQKLRIEGKDNINILDWTSRELTGAHAYRAVNLTT